MGQHQPEIRLQSPPQSSACALERGLLRPDAAQLRAEYVTDPRAQAQVQPPYYDSKRRKAETWNKISYQPREGRLIVFPGWLQHAVQPNLSEEQGGAGDRISISFNFNQLRRADVADGASRREIVRGDLLD